MAMVRWPNLSNVVIVMTIEVAEMLNPHQLEEFVDGLQIGILENACGLYILTIFLMAFYPCQLKDSMAVASLAPDPE
jgi:hypothetical protein